jgi:hypothetical protein
MTGILTNNVEAVRKIIIDELTLFVGISPQIKIEGINKRNNENRRKEREHSIYNHYVITNPVSDNISMN